VENDNSICGLKKFEVWHGWRKSG